MPVFEWVAKILHWLELLIQIIEQIVTFFLTIHQILCTSLLISIPLYVAHSMGSISKSTVFTILHHLVFVSAWSNEWTSFPLVPWRNCIHDTKFIFSFRDQREPTCVEWRRFSILAWNSTYFIWWIISWTSKWVFELKLVFFLPNLMRPVQSVILGKFIFCSI